MLKDKIQYFLTDQRRTVKELAKHVGMSDTAIRNIYQRDSCELSTLRKITRNGMKWALLILIALFASCADNKQREVGQYVYEDCLHTIHIDRECASNLVENPKTKEERFAKMTGVRFIDTCNLTLTSGGNFSYQRDFCPRCIDDRAYQHLSRIMERNQNEDTECAVSYVAN